MSKQLLRSWTFRISAALITVMLAIFITGWLWVETTDARGQSLVSKGVPISDQLKQFSKAFQSGDTETLSALFHTEAMATPWRIGVAANSLPFGLQIFHPEESSATSDIEALDLFEGWRGSIGTVDSSVFRLLVLDDFSSSDDAKGRVRFEVRGRNSDALSLVDRGVLLVGFRLQDQQWRISHVSLEEGVRTTGAGDYFVDLAAQSGLDFVLAPDPRTEQGDMELRFELGKFGYAGLTAGDYNGDGFDDLFFGSGGASALFRNQGDGTFQDVTVAAGLTGLSHVTTAILADFDNDFDADLYVGVFIGPNRLFKNNGDGTFSDVTGASGLMPDEFTAAVAVADLNNDGLLDIYVASYLDPVRQIPQQRIYARNGEPNRLYLNTGDLTFRDHTEASGSGDAGLGLSLAISDYDVDGDQDIYVVNDFGRNVLLQNQGDATFKDIAKEANALAVGAGMSGQWADYNSDGLLDLYVTGIRSDLFWFVQPETVRRTIALALKRFPSGDGNLGLYWDLLRHMGRDWDQAGVMANGGNYLLENQGDGTFLDVSSAANVQGQGWYWSAALFDYDNDADLDIYAVNGFISQNPDRDLGQELDLEAFARPYEEGYTFSLDYVGNDSLNGHERNTMHVNLDHEQYVEAANALGLDSLRDGRGMAISDFDHDGDLDIVVNNYGAAPSYFVNQRGNAQNWLQVRLLGRTNNRDGVGAVIRVRTEDRWQTRLVAAGEGYASQFSLTAHFGVGTAVAIDELQVWWPNGNRQTFSGLPANHWLTVDEDRSVAIIQAWE